MGANTVVLTVTDGNSGANMANLTVNVTANYRADADLCGSFGQWRRFDHQQPDGGER